MLNYDDLPIIYVYYRLIIFANQAGTFKIHAYHNNHTFYALIGQQCPVLRREYVFATSVGRMIEQIWYLFLNIVKDSGNVLILHTLIISTAFRLNSKKKR